MNNQFRGLHRLPIATVAQPLSARAGRPGVFDSAAAPADSPLKVTGDSEGDGVPPREGRSW